MAKQPVVGLGDVSFDPSLQTDEVDHDFFDNPASLPEPEQLQNNETNNVEEAEVVPETKSSAVRSGFPLEPIRILTESPPPCPVDSHEIFSTGTLLACLNNPPTEANVETNSSLSGPHSFRRYCYGSDGNITKSPKPKGKKSKRQPQIKLFDISDSSSDESAGSDESDEELNNFMEKYFDLLDVDDTDNSDITEVSPMSSLTVSPLPTFGGGEGSGNEDSNHSVDASSGIKYPSSHLGFRTIPAEFAAQINAEKSELEALKVMIPALRQKILLAGEDSQPPPNPFTGIYPERKDHNQNGDRSPSESSCLSACGSTNNSCSSSMSFNVSSKRSCCSSSTSSSCSSTGPKKSGRNFTFTPEQLKRIERENNILLKKILDVSRVGHHNHHHHLTHGIHRGTHRNAAARNIQAAASIARQKQQRKIDHDNLMLMKRLQSAKPSKEVGEAFKNKPT